jgi:hypothetical protein
MMLGLTAGLKSSTDRQTVFGRRVSSERILPGDAVWEHRLGVKGRELAQTDRGAPCFRHLQFLANMQERIGISLGSLFGSNQTSKKV